MMTALMMLAAAVGGFIVWRQLTAGGGDSEAGGEGDKAAAEAVPPTAAKRTPTRPMRASPDPAAGGPATPAAKRTPTRPMRASPDTGGMPAMPATPTEKAEHAERKFRKALESEGCELAPSAFLCTLAENVAQGWIALEDVKRAADVYRDARVYDKALKLYVNTLKDFPTAALVAANKGDHVLAAKLHTYLGDKEKALESWVEWGRTATNPLLHIKAMRAFGEEQFASVLVGIIETRPAAQNDAELLFGLGGALEAGGFAQPALRVFTRLAGAMPDYKDVAARRAELEQRVAAEARSAIEAENAGLFEVLALPTIPASNAFDSEPPSTPLELPRIEDEPSEPSAEEVRESSPDASQTEPLVKTALAALALVSAARRVRPAAVEEVVARTGNDDR